MHVYFFKIFSAIQYKKKKETVSLTSIRKKASKRQRGALTSSEGDEATQPN